MPALAKRLGMTNQRSAGNAWAALRKKLAERDPRSDIKTSTLDTPKAKAGAKRAPKAAAPSSPGAPSTPVPSEGTSVSVAAAEPTSPTSTRKRGRPAKAKPATAALIAAVNDTAASTVVKTEKDDDVIVIKGEDDGVCPFDGEMATPPSKRARITKAKAKAVDKTTTSPKKAATAPTTTRVTRISGAKVKGGSGGKSALAHKKLSGMTATSGDFADDERSSSPYDAPFNDAATDLDAEMGVNMVADAHMEKKVYGPKERDCISDLEFDDDKVKPEPANDDGDVIFVELEPMGGVSAAAAQTNTKKNTKKNTKGAPQVKNEDDEDQEMNDDEDQEMNDASAIKEESGADDDDKAAEDQLVQGI